MKSENLGFWLWAGWGKRSESREGGDCEVSLWMEDSTRDTKRTSRVFASRACASGIDCGNENSDGNSRNNSFSCLGLGF